MKTLISFLKLTYHLYPGLFGLLVFSSFIQMVSGLFTVYGISIVVGYLELKNNRLALYWIVAVIVLEALFYFLKRICEGEIEVAKSKMNQLINQLVSNKIMTLPFSYLEDPYYVQLKEDALMGVNNMGAIYTFFEGFLSLLSNGVLVIALMSIIISFDIRLLGIVLLGVVFTIGITWYYNRSQIQYFNNLLPINFKFSYYVDTLVSDAHCKDFRIFSIYDVLFKQMQYFNEKMQKYFLKLSLQNSLYNTMVATIRYIILALVYILVGILTIQRSETVAQFTLVTSSIISFSNSISAMITSFSGFLRGIEYVKPILTFMDIPTTQWEGKEVLEEVETISFEHVSFTYPHTDKKVLDDVSFEIHRNEKISIVGLNGAGKTTVIKLLCKLYEPEEGKIKINGKNILEYTNDSYVSQLSAVFQDYTLFHYSIRDNVKPDIEQDTCKKILEEVGIYDAIKKLPDGMESYIGKGYEDSGIDMSGGQKQKIAIARAICKQAQILILDEPTSALDPLAEAEIYENFNLLAKDRTAIYVSHRMSSSIFCDKILVLNHGKVEAFAPHEELMQNKNSLYYTLFTTQAKNYSLN